MSQQQVLWTRTMAAFIFTPLLLLVVVWGGGVLDSVCLALTWVMLWEFLHITFGPGFLATKIVVQILGLMMTTQALGWLPPLLGFMHLVVIVLLLTTLLYPEPLATSLLRVAAAFLAIVYCGGLLSYLAALRALPRYGVQACLMVILCTWGADTAAYFAGQAWGRHKLYTKVSPAKTWEGATAGLLAALLIAGLLWGLWRSQYPIGLLDALCLAMIAAIFGLLGDLSESMLKRASYVKDSSQLIPGHGGVLDRFDALLFALPCCYAYLWLKAKIVAF